MEPKTFWKTSHFRPEIDLHFQQVKIWGSNLTPLHINNNQYLMRIISLEIGTQHGF
jgi:hypothetical protein